MPSQESSGSPASRRTDPLGLLACVAAAAFFFAVSFCKIDSLDTGYHLAYGGRFLDGKGIVDRDPFLYPDHAIQFVNANWGSQVIMALVYRIAGASGLIALRTLLIAWIAACIALVLRRFVKSRAWLAAAWLLAGAAGYERFSLRPELFSYAIMLTMLVLLLRSKMSRALIVSIPILQLLWVNLHSYFLVGLMLSGSFLIDASLAMKPTAESNSGARAGAKPATRARFFAALFATQVVVTFMNPWSGAGAVFPVQTLAYLSREKVMGVGPADSAANAWSLISEFHSPFAYLGEQINARTVEAYLLLLVVVGGAIVIGVLRRRFDVAIFLIILTAMSIQMRRNIAQLALAGTPLALGVISEITRGPNRAMALRRLRWPLSLALIVSSLIAYDWVISGRLYYTERRITRQFGTGLSSRTFTTDAVKWLAAQPAVQPNLFVDYFASSNTLPWLPPRFKLFVDTNTFAVSEPTLATAFKLGLGQLPHTETFDREQINVALLHAGPDTQPLIRNLVADYTNWALVYFDPQAVIFIRRIPEHLEIIKAHRPTASDLDVRAWIAAYDEPACTKALSLGTAVNIPLALGWHAPAAELAREATRLAPDYHDAWYFLAVSEANLGKAAAREKKLADARSHFIAAKQAAETAAGLAPSHEPSRSLANELESVISSMPR